MTTKIKIMKCLNCQSYVKAYCKLWDSKVFPSDRCTMFDERPGETLDSGNDVETGVDIDLQEKFDLDGDDEENWTPVVPYRAK